MPRRGVSLLALLLILALLVIFFGFTFAGVRQVRGAAMNARVANNLMQIGLAVHNYLSDRGKFPGVCDYGKGSVHGAGVPSAHFQILPYLEQDAVHRMYQAAQPQTYYDKDTGAARIVIRTYLADSDPSANAGAMKSASVTVKAPGAKAPFAANFSGVYATTNYPFNAMMMATGMKITDITDGTSNTIMIGERFQVCKSGDGDKSPTATSPDVYCLWGLGAYSAHTAAFALETPKGDGVPTAEPANRMFVPKSSQDGNVAKGYWAHDPGKAVEYGAATVAGARGGFQTLPLGNTMCDARVPQALTPRGLTVCMGDGSCRTIANNISSLTFWRAVTPSGGEVLGQDW